MDLATASLDVHLNPLPGKTKPPTVILKRGKDSNMSLWGWHETVRGHNLSNLRLSATFAESDRLEITMAEDSDQEIETTITCAAVPPQSSSPGSVQGTVKTKGVDVAPEATIELRVGDAVKGTAKTNDKGEYKIEVPADDYPAVAALLSAPRDKPLTVGINVSAV